MEDSPPLLASGKRGTHPESSEEVEVVRCGFYDKEISIVALSLLSLRRAVSLVSVPALCP